VRALYSITPKIANFSAAFLGDVHERAVAMVKITQIHFALGQLDEALQTLRDEALPAFVGLGDVPSLVFVRANLARILLRRNQLGDRQEAIPLLRQALEAARSLRLPEAQQIEGILRDIGEKP
jgi:tetratricopeptide (TPR) repeat protein